MSTDFSIEAANLRGSRCHLPMRSTSAWRRRILVSIFSQSLHFVPVATVCMMSFMPHVSPIRYSLAQCCRKWPHFQSPQAHRCWSKKHMFQALSTGMSAVWSYISFLLNRLDHSARQRTRCYVVKHWTFLIGPTIVHLAWVSSGVISTSALKDTYEMVGWQATFNDSRQGLRKRKRRNKELSVVKDGGCSKFLVNDWKFWSR